jgi:hypothetical protein
MITSASGGLFAFVCLGGGGFDPENGFVFFHQVEPVARDRFEINRIGLEEIHFTGLLCQQHLLFVALSLELIDLLVSEFQFLIRRDEEADDDEPDREEKQSQEDTIPTLPNGSFASRAEI